MYTCVCYYNLCNSRFISVSSDVVNRDNYSNIDILKFKTNDSITLYVSLTLQIYAFVTLRNLYSQITKCRFITPSSGHKQSVPPVPTKPFTSHQHVSLQNTVVHSLEMKSMLWLAGAENRDCDFSVWCEALYSDCSFGIFTFIFLWIPLSFVHIHVSFLPLLISSLYPWSHGTSTGDSHKRISNYWPITPAIN